MKKLSTLILSILLLTGYSQQSQAGTKVLYSQDYTNVTDISTVWSGKIVSLKNDAKHGNYARIQGHATRYKNPYGGVTTFQDAKPDWTKIVKGAYTLEFDLSIESSAISGARSGELVLMDSKSTSITDFTKPFSSVTDNATKNLFYMAAANTANTYTVNNTSTNITINSKTTNEITDLWYHYKFVVDITNKTVSYTISDGDAATDDITGTYSVTDESDMYCTGIFLYSGRNTNEGSNIDNIKITTETDEVTATAPTIQLTGIKGLQRTYSISFLDGETLHYTLPGGTEQTATTSPQSVSTSTSGTLTAWTTNGSATSDQTTVNVVAEILQLNAPTYKLDNLQKSGDIYFPTFSFTDDNNDVYGTPTAAGFSYTFTDYAGNVTTGTGDTFTATAAGTLAVKATAPTDYANSAETTFNVYAYDQNQTIDLTNTNLIADLTTLTQATNVTWNGFTTGMESATYYTCPEYLVSDLRCSTSTTYVYYAPGFGIGLSTSATRSFQLRNCGSNEVGEFIYYSDGDLSTNNSAFDVASSGHADFTLPNSGNSTALKEVIRYTTSNSTASSLSITMNDYGKMTFSSDKALDFTNVTGLSAYAATSIDESGDLIMTKVTSAVPANTGLYLTGTASETTTVPIVISATAPTTNFFKPSVTATDVAASTEGTYHYFLMRGTNGVGFYNVDANITSAAGKAYLETSSALATTGSASPINLIFNDGSTTTGINTINTVQKASNKIYDLCGQEVSTPVKGLYIMNGKKVVIK